MYMNFILEAANKKLMLIVESCCVKIGKKRCETMGMNY